MLSIGWIGVLACRKSMNRDTFMSVLFVTILTDAILFSL